MLTLNNVCFNVVHEETKRSSTGAIVKENVNVTVPWLKKFYFGVSLAAVDYLHDFSLTAL